ncbi:MAG: hypothetical protein HFJ42_00530 [Clostridia bacterium]|nr:hypothetical protein [Clostridia bacterium]
MKKLEKLLNKIVGDLRADELLKILVIILLGLLYTGIGILTATDGYYLMLAIAVFYLVWFIAEYVIKKVFLKKLDDYLIKTPKATVLIYVIICVIVIALSVEHFIGVILSAILAFVVADVFKNIKYTD